MNDMPPGVSENDIPGNRPEDVKFELAVEELTNYDPEMAVKVLRAVMPMAGDIEKQGYADGYRDGAHMAREDWADKEEQMAMTLRQCETLLVSISGRRAMDEPLAGQAWYLVQKIRKVDPV